MQDEQPPITNDTQYQGYQLALEKSTQVAEAHERVLFDNRCGPFLLRAILVGWRLICPIYPA